MEWPADQLRVRIRSSGKDEDELVVNARSHAKSEHNMELTARQVLAVAEPAED